MHVSIFSLPNLLTGVYLLVCSSRFSAQTFFDPEGFSAVWTLFRWTIFTLAIQLHFLTVFKSLVLLCSVHVCMIFFCSMAEMNKLIEEKVIRVTLEETILKNGQPALTLYDTTTTHLYIQPSLFLFSQTTLNLVFEFVRLCEWP